MKKPKSETTLRVKREMREMAESFFVGIAIPSLVAIEDQYVIEDEEYVYGTGINETIKGQRYAVCEKLLKFASRKSSKVKRFKHNPRFDTRVVDRMIDPVGKPGSQERITALTERYAAIEASGLEISPFCD